MEKRNQEKRDLLERKGKTKKEHCKICDKNEDINF